jgi:hypothetical protein
MRKVWEGDLIPGAKAGTREALATELRVEGGKRI